MNQPKKPLGLSKPKKLSTKRVIEISDSLMNAPTKTMKESDENYAKSERYRKLAYAKMNKSDIQKAEARKDSLAKESLRNEVLELKKYMMKKYPGKVM
jgi:hypothetical protein